MSWHSQGSGSQVDPYDFTHGEDVDELEEMEEEGGPPDPPGSPSLSIASSAASAPWLQPNSHYSRVPNGLSNDGAGPDLAKSNCFLNAALQFLGANKALQQLVHGIYVRVQDPDVPVGGQPRSVNQVLAALYPDQANRFDVVNAFGHIVTALYSVNRGVVDPEPFLEKLPFLGFNRHQQSDSAECIQSLIRRLVEGHRQFEPLYHSTITFRNACSKCNHHSDSEEVVTEFLIPIGNEGDFEAAWRNAPWRHEKTEASAQCPAGNEDCDDLGTQRFKIRTVVQVEPSQAIITTLSSLNDDHEIDQAHGFTIPTFYAFRPATGELTAIRDKEAFIQLHVEAKEEDAERILFYKLRAVDLIRGETVVSGHNMTLLVQDARKYLADDSIVEEWTSATLPELCRPLALQLERYWPAGAGDRVSTSKLVVWTPPPPTPSPEIPIPDEASISTGKNSQATKAATFAKSKATSAATAPKAATVKPTTDTALQDFLWPRYMAEDSHFEPRSSYQIAEHGLQRILQLFDFWHAGERDLHSHLGEDLAAVLDALADGQPCPRNKHVYRQSVMNDFYKYVSTSASVDDTVMDSELFLERYTDWTKQHRSARHQSGFDMMPRLDPYHHLRSKEGKWMFYNKNIARGQMLRSEEGFLVAGSWEERHFRKALGMYLWGTGCWDDDGKLKKAPKPALAKTARLSHITARLMANLGAILEYWYCGKAYGGATNKFNFSAITKINPEVREDLEDLRERWIERLEREWRRDPAFREVVRQWELDLLGDVTISEVEIPSDDEDEEDGSQ